MTDTPEQVGAPDTESAGGGPPFRRPAELLGIAGSLREGSFNRALIRAAGELVPERVRLRAYDRLREIPPYDQDEDVEPPPEAVAHLRRSIGEADGVLFATPEYNHSVPGVLKNAVDWASRPYEGSSLTGKPVAVVGASPSRFGARWAQEDLRRILEASGATVLDVELPVSRASERIVDGRLEDREVRERLEEIVTSLAARPADADEEGREAATGP